MEVNSLPNNNQGSLKNGIWLVFNENNENVIKYWQSSYTGKEKIFINDRLIVEQRNWSTKNETSFLSSKGEEYKMLYKVHKLRVPEYILYKGDDLIGNYKVLINIFKFKKITVKAIILRCLGLFLTTLIVLLLANFLIIKYQFPSYLDEVLAVLSWVLFMYLLFKNSRIKTETHTIIDLLEK